ncbi:MAG TPA: hypothetical protein VK668_21455 [Mucilaginibacter sp.]|nr:hypothetical protein [Mucilaginibacter sp.]
MKKILSLTLLIAVMLTTFITSCKKSSDKKPDYTCATCKTTPDAVAANDNSSKGIYKGIVVGSTGTIKFDINNAGNTVTATLVIDGVTVNLTSAITWTAGVAYTAPFTGTLNGAAVTINFTVSDTGEGPSVTSSNIPGHAGAVFSLAKESSTALVEAYEGTYTTTKPESGTFNILLSRALARWGAVARKDGSSEASHGNGTIVNGVLIDTSNKSIGTLSGDGIDGKFTDSNGITITLTGKRTL